MRFSRILAAALLAAPMVASAVDVTGTFQVSAKVLPTCKVTTANIDVASYDPNVATATTQSGTVSVACTKKTAYTTTLVSTNGWTLNGTGGEKLTYGILQGSTTTPWNATSGVSATSTGKDAVSYVATVSIAPLQDVAVDTYTDTVTVNVNY